MNIDLIKFFNKALVSTTPGESAIDHVELNKKAIQKGYIIHPDCCTESVARFLNDVAINPNATFYKTWEDVTSKSRLELLIDQLIHYATTYGTDFSMGNGYVPNDGDIEDIPYESYKLILPITNDELYQKCFDTLCSGIALNGNTMTTLCDFVVTYVKYVGDVDINIDAIKNREALIYICDQLGLVPQEKFSLLRYIVFKTTGETMVIKNNEMYRRITNSCNPFDFTRLKECNIIALSSIFLRYKKLFLAFRHTTKQNAEIINKMRRLAKKTHAPMEPGFWQNIFSIHQSIDDMEKHLGELTSYKKVALMQSCIERSRAAHSGNDEHLYIVRNQKSFVRKDYKVNADITYLAGVYAVLYNSLLETLKKNSIKEVKETNPETGEVITRLVPKTIRFAEGLNVSLPTSEKSFIGNYPFGTAFDMTTDNFIGIYWRNEWNTHDFDLSVLECIEPDKGRTYWQRIGWCGDYQNSNNNIVFSGDMTNASPEATEILYIRKNNKNIKGVVRVNQFSGCLPSKFRLFVGQEMISNLTKNYMVNPNSIRLNVEVPVETSKDQTIAVLNGDSIVLMNINMKSCRISNATPYTKGLIEQVYEKSHCFVQTRDILKDAGFQIVGDDYDGTPDIDFANLEKDSLISIMKD